jgi:hypothetical protein
MGVVAYFCGHTHNYSAYYYDGICQLDAGHARGEGDTEAASTFLLIHVEENTVTFDAYRDGHDGVYDYDDILHSGTLAPLPVFIHFQDGVSPDTGYSGTLDTVLSNVAINGNLGAYAWDGNPWADYSAFMSPITSDVKANLRSIMTDGESKGRVLGRMGQIGDSITNASPYFRNAILVGSSGNETNHDYSDVRSWMAYSGTQPADSSSFYNAHGKEPDYGNLGGWTLDDAVAANHPFAAVEVGDGLTPGNFSWALIMFGTNDIDNPSWDAQSWKADYSAFVQEFINLGVIPVLSTIPPELAHIADGRVELANDQIKSLATELNIPFVDYYALVLHYQPVAWVGTLISDDGTHPSAGGGGTDFSENGLTSSDGYAARTKLTWDMAEKLKNIVFEKKSICQCDMDQDGDVDGKDLADYIANPGSIDLNDLGAEFGGTSCLL